MKITIIIPVYNVASYVGRCLDSVFAQTYSDIECIIVDDCGSDNSMDIVRDKLDSYVGPIEFKIIAHEKNRGLSAARNTGTDAAIGEYVYYLDSDDMIFPDTIELLVKVVEKDRLDFVIGNYASGGDGAVVIPLRVPFNISYSQAEILSTYLDRKWFMMAWNKLVSHEFIKRNQLAFVEGIIHEDELWSFQLACLAESMGAVSGFTYVYRIRSNSITQKPSRGVLDSWIRISNEAEAFVKKHDLTQDTGICNFLTLWREKLAYRAKPFGLNVAYKVYVEHVRKPSILNCTGNKLSGINRVWFFHHFMPPAPGYFYYAIVFRIYIRILDMFRFNNSHSNG